MISTGLLQINLWKVTNWALKDEGREGGPKERCYLVALKEVQDSVILKLKTHKGLKRDLYLGVKGLWQRSLQT